MALLSTVRVFLYCALWIFSVVLLGLTAARIHYTENLSPNDPLNDGRHFYDPVVAELLATSILAMLWSMFAIHAIHTRRDYRLIHTFAAEVVGLFILFIMWLVGTAIATSFWGNLGWCHQFAPCRLLTALVAIAWVGWVLLFFLLSASLIHAVVNRAWTEPMHGHLYPRDSFAPRETSEYRGSRL
ncbi:hypothetical protein BC834DRAFT_1039217 [Gloeopeniophorella convolvens]|nr:hypothetical protein BC834DRAFT_1039217 [Gloeopeniophorella convolvens]